MTSFKLDERRVRRRLHEANSKLKELLWMATRGCGVGAS